MSVCVCPCDIGVRTTHHALVHKAVIEVGIIAEHASDGVCIAGDVIRSEF